MLESQSYIHKRPTALTSIALILLLGWLSFHSSYGTVQTDIEITSPPYNTVLNTASTVISGTYASNYPPTITLTIENSNYVVSVDPTHLTWSTSISTSEGWHTAKVTINDNGKTLVTSTQFMINTGGNKAQIKYPVLNIEYSQACRALIKHGDYSTCPKLSDIASFDTSNQHVSGKLVIDKNGIMTRTEPQLKNAYNFYKNFTICVDCQIDAATESTMQTIFFDPTSFPYTKHSFTSVSTNVTGFIKLVPYNYTTTFNEQNAGMTVYYDRYVTDDCMVGNLVYSSALLQDTINYMKSGCKITFFNKTTTTVIPKHTIDYAKAPQYQYMNYIHKSLRNNVGNCITQKCDAVPNPQNNFNGAWSIKKK